MQIPKFYNQNNFSVSVAFWQYGDYFLPRFHYSPKTKVQSSRGFFCFVVVSMHTNYTFLKLWLHSYNISYNIALFFCRKKPHNFRYSAQSILLQTFGMYIKLRSDSTGVVRAQPLLLTAQLTLNRKQFCLSYHLNVLL